jgi:PIN domain nuclease of toxin-antitoxin system
MTDWVLDASAVLAYIKGEPGAETVAAALPTAILSAASAGEVVTKLIRYGFEPRRTVEMVQRLAYVIVPVDAALGLRAGELAAITQPKGLSLGDRICLALAEQEGLTALTTDHGWIELGLDIKVSLIR